MKPFEKLSSEEKAKLWAEVNRSIRTSIEPIKKELGADYGTVIDYLDANEFGLALDHVVATLVEENIAVSPTTTLALKKLTERMQLDSSSVSVQGLKKLQKN